MVQKRHFHKNHVDEHYCAAVFQYLREYALKYCHHSLLVCLDDKYRVKVGEPGYPVAAAEREGEELLLEIITLLVLALYLVFCSVLISQKILKARGILAKCVLYTKMQFSSHLLQ